MLCIYRSKANFAENMANNVKKRVKVPASTPKRKQRMVCLMSEEEVRIVDCALFPGYVIGIDIEFVQPTQ